MLTAQGKGPLYTAYILAFLGIQPGLQYQLQVFLIARLVEHCTRITEITCSIPVPARNVFHALRGKTVCFAGFTGICRSGKQG